MGRFLKTLLLFYFFYQFFKCFRVFNCHLRQNFPVNFYLFILKHLDEFVVFESVFFQCVSQSFYPERSICSFFVSSVSVSIFSGFEESFLGSSESGFSPPFETFGCFDNLFSSLGGSYSAFYSRHIFLKLVRRDLMAHQVFSINKYYKFGNDFRIFFSSALKRRISFLFFLLKFPVSLVL